MAEYIKFDKVHSQEKELTPSDYGFIYVPLYGETRDEIDVFSEEIKWINKNIEGAWTTWFFHFDNSDNKNNRCNTGRSFAFKLEEDLMAFKLRWL